MLGKLIAYEFRGVWKPALIILIIMAVAGVAGSMSLATVDALTDNYSYSSSDVTTDLSIVLTLFTLFAGLCGPVWWGCSSWRWCASTAPCSPTRATLPLRCRCPPLLL